MMTMTTTADDELSGIYIYYNIWAVYLVFSLTRDGGFGRVLYFVFVFFKSPPLTPPNGLFQRTIAINEQEEKTSKKCSHVISNNCVDCILFIIVTTTISQRRTLSVSELLRIVYTLYSITNFAQYIIIFEKYQTLNINIIMLYTYIRPNQNFIGYFFF